MRYFFHVMSDHTAYKDEAGRSFSDVKIAKAHAASIASELAIEVENYVGFSVRVTGHCQSPLGLPAVTFSPNHR